MQADYGREAMAFFTEELPHDREALLELFAWYNFRDDVGNPLTENPFFRQLITEYIRLTRRHSPVRQAPLSGTTARSLPGRIRMLWRRFRWLCPRLVKGGQGISIAVHFDHPHGESSGIQQAVTDAEHALHSAGIAFTRMDTSSGTIWILHPVQGAMSVFFHP